MGTRHVGLIKLGGQYWHGCIQCGINYRGAVGDVSLGFLTPGHGKNKDEALEGLGKSARSMLHRYRAQISIEMGCN